MCELQTNKLCHFVTLSSKFLKRAELSLLVGDVIYSGIKCRYN